MLMKKCCCCFTPKTGTVVLGCLGIIASVLCMVPHVLLLENHKFYIQEFVKQQTITGVRDITDEDVPALEYFSRLVWSTLVSVEVLTTFCSILLIAGVVCERRHFLVPWLVTDFCLNLVAVVMVLAFMFSFSNDFSFVIFAVASPFLGMSAYFWFVVYSTFHQMRKECDVSTPLSFSAGMVSLGGGRGQFRQSLGQPVFCDDRPSSGQMGPISIEQPSCTTVSTAEEGRMSFSQVSGSTSINSMNQHKTAYQLEKAAVAAALTKATGAKAKRRSPKINKNPSGEATPPPPYDAVAIDINKEEEVIKAGVAKENLTFSKQNSLQDSKSSSKSCSSSSLSGPTSRISTGTAPSCGDNSTNDVPTATLVTPEILDSNTPNGSSHSSRNSSFKSQNSSASASLSHSPRNPSLANSDTDPDLIEVDVTQDLAQA